MTLAFALVSSEPQRQAFAIARGSSHPPLPGIADLARSVFDIILDSSRRPVHGKGANIPVLGGGEW